MSLSTFYLEYGRHIARLHLRRRRRRRRTRRIKSFFPYKDKLAPSFRSKVVYRAKCWDCNDFYIGKTKRRLRDRKTEHFKALTTNCHESAIADHVFLTNHSIKWDHFEILATGRSDMHCKIKESLLVRDLKPALNENVVRNFRNFISIIRIFLSFYVNQFR